MARGLMRLPFVTFGVLSSFSGLWLFAFVEGALFDGAFCFFGSLGKNGLDGVDKFREIDGGPARKTANK